MLAGETTAWLDVGKITELPAGFLIDITHTAAKNMIEHSRTQDEECGDGTTSVIILGRLSC